MIRLKFAYKKTPYGADLTVLCADFGDAPYLSATNFRVYADTFSRVGHKWNEPRERLGIVARAVAKINGRKNVRTTEAPEGVLF